MKIQTVKSARFTLIPRNCRRCGHAILAGETYRHIKPRYGRPSYYCKDHHPRASEMHSGKLSEILATQEGLEEDLEAYGREEIDLDGLLLGIEGAMEEAERIAEEYEESASNLDEHFPGSLQVDELNERAEAIKDWQQELESAKSELEDLETDPEDPKAAQAVELMEQVQQILESAIASLAI